MHKVFISYHHDGDQGYKDRLLELNNEHDIFIDRSVDTGDIDEALDDQAIRSKIRDEYLGDSTVTIVLAGSETGKRKHVDWEIYSSMFDGAKNKKSGVLVITVPPTERAFYTATHSGEQERVYPDITSWGTIEDRSEYERRYPYLPDRLIDNLMTMTAKVSVTGWSRIEGAPGALRFLIDMASRDRASCVYDLSRPMRKANS